METDSTPAIRMPRTIEELPPCLTIIAAAALLAWPLLDGLYYRQPQILSSVKDMIAGFTSIRLLLSRPQQAWWLAGGLLSLELAWAALPLDCKPHGKKVPLVRNIDDTLWVLYTHAFAGVIGGFLALHRLH